VLGPLVPVHPSQSHPNGSGGYDDHSVSIFAKLHGGLDNDRQDGEQGLMGVFVNNGTRA
jgi:hypothetical protein